MTKQQFQDKCFYDAMPFGAIEHTADIGIRVWSAEMPGLFADAALGMAAQIAGSIGKNHDIPAKAKHLDVSGFDKEDLLFNWLREILAFWHMEAELPCRVESLKIDKGGTAMSADFKLYRPDTRKNPVLHDIKAVTYHGLRIERKNGLWTATIIFDV